MRFVGLALQSIRHYWRLTLCLAAGVFLASTVLTGSLVVGDSVKETLRRAGALRTGRIEYALLGGERFFTTALADAIRVEAGGALVAPVLLVEGSVSNTKGTERANAVQIAGIDRHFLALAPDGNRDALPQSGFVAVSAALAHQLGATVGDTVLARMERPGALSKDAPLSGSTDETVTIRKKITHILSDEEFARFSLKAEQGAPMNLFLPLAELQEKLETPGRANLLLAGGEGLSEERLGAAAQAHWDLADLALRTREVPVDGWEVFSDRIFVSKGEETALRATVPEAKGSLTYLVNQIDIGESPVAPYSMVAAVSEATAEKLAPGLGKGEAAINAWLAERGVKVGDTIALKYFVVADGRQMREESAEFKVVAIIPMEAPEMNPSWMPDFPGISDVDNCRDWDPGFAIDQSSIRDEDEKYWDDYKGTPKVFIRLDDGQAIWANRFGALSALRFPEGPLTAEALRPHLAMTDVGFSLRAVGAEAAMAAAKSLDFGALFAGLSMFLIAAALILVAMLFIFGLEQRGAQAGVLLAMGFRPNEVRRLFLLEAGLLAFLASALGAVGGIAYTRVALWGLGSVWRDAVARLDFSYHSRPLSIVAGAFGVFVIAMLTVWWASRRLLRVQPKELVAGQGTGGTGAEDVKGRKAIACAVGGALGGAALLVAARGKDGEMLAGLFYGAGMLLMVSGLGGLAILLRRWAMERGAARSLAELSRRNATRRRGRSLSVAAVMASGVFMVVAVNSFRLPGVGDPAERASGTGGFRYTGTSTLPVYEDLDSVEGREKFGLEDLSGADLGVVSFRVRADGEEASCLNLNAVAQPRLMGVDPSALARREAFVFAGTEKGTPVGKSPWELLDTKADDGTVAGIADKASAMWAMHKKLGDEVIYSDGMGGELRVRLVGFLANSVLQGSVIIAEDHFKKAFPDAGGYRFFLVETPGGARSGEVVGEMTRQLGGRGLALTPSAERLAAYNEVQNTYLTIFSTLGGLGVLLGTLGVGLVIGRNVMERRGELALMRAVGFERAALSKMVVREHWLLLLLGVLIGAAAALIAVLPNLTASGGGGLPLVLLAILVAAILVAGFLFCWISARWTLRGGLMGALRTE